MDRFSRLGMALCLVLAVGCASSRPAVESKKAPAAAPAGSKPLPVDPNVKEGKLENGLRYYIRVNHEPEKRAELRLVVNAGSILEDPDQQGLAHFAEHMAFNGTAHFPKQALVDYLESIGMRFGADLNAYTSFDETVYRLQVPTDSTGVMEKAFQILEDWAHNVSYDPSEIDKERGVVIEEWRLGRGASARMRDKQFPILFKGSRYADRLPIGQKAVLDTFHYATLKRFYREWYRPDLEAVVAVGDFDPARVDSLIRMDFSVIRNPKPERPRVVFPVPDHKKTLFAIASDPEATWSSVQLYYLQDVRKEGTVGAYRQDLVESLYNGMLNERLRELTKKPDAPFLGGYSGQGHFVRSKDVYFLSARVKENGVEQGLRALLTEAARVQQHGFTPSELAREKTDLLRGMEQLYRERDKVKSASFAAEYIRNYLRGEPIPGIAAEYALYQKLLPDIRLAEVNRLAGEWMTDQNRVVLVDVPKKEGVEVPTQARLQALIDSVKGETIAPYVDRVSNEPLVEKVPAPGKVVSEKSIPELGVTEWTLSNGVKVVLKPTNFKNDQVLFTSFSPGGTSVVSDRNYIPAATAVSALQEGGLGRFGQVELEKKLAGKVVSVSPWIDDLDEGVSGSASPEDMETLFQLIYLTFTAPRPDSTAFLAYRNRLRGYLQNRSAQPETAFYDTLEVTLAQHHFRARPWTESVLNEMDLRRSYIVYRQRFADASGFTFFFVGNFEPEKIRPMVETYLGGLPALHRNETWRDVGMRPPTGVVQREVEKGVAPKSRTQIVFTGPFEWTRQNRYDLNAMASVLRIKLREVLRENMGGTYGVGVGASPSHYPVPHYSFSISFGSAPNRVDTLTKAVFAQIDSLKSFGTTPDYLNRVQEMELRGRETALRENRFWLNALESALENGEDPREIQQYDALVHGLTSGAIQKAAQQYLDTKNYVRVVLYPKNGPGAGE